VCVSCSLVCVCVSHYSCACVVLLTVCVRRVTSVSRAPRVCVCRFTSVCACFVLLVCATWSTIATPISSDSNTIATPAGYRRTLMLLNDAPAATPSSAGCCCCCCCCCSPHAAVFSKARSRLRASSHSCRSCTAWLRRRAASPAASSLLLLASSSSVASSVFASLL
jgi:hypothetical protein